MEQRRADEWETTAQGEPLPDTAKLDGQWIHKPYFFLYRTLEGEASGKVTHTRAIPLSDGSYSVGIDSASLSSSLNLSEDSLFRHNTLKTLFLAIGKDPAPRYGKKATSYRLRVGDSMTVITFETGLMTGTA